MKTVLHFTWWFGILAATWVSSNANHGTNGMFHQVLPSTTSTKQSVHHTKKRGSFSSIFVGESLNTGGTGSGFQPLGKRSSESKHDSSTASPTVASDGRRKGESKAPKSSPTQSPTAYTTISAIDEEEDVQDIDRPVKQKATIMAEPRTIQLKGDFDPQQSEQVIFQATESLMRSYMNTYGGDILASFELSLIFFHEYDHLTSVQGHPLMTMYFDVDVVFYVASYDMDAIANFSRNKATKLVERFFSGTHLTRLKRRLSAKGLKIKDAQLFSSLPENIPRSDTGDKYQPFVSRSGGKQSGENTVLYAALASAAIMFFAIVCIILISRREFRKSLKTVLGSLSNSRGSSSYSDSSGSTTVSGGIKPAALHIRRKREEELARQAETSSLDGFPYSDRSFGSNFVRAHQPFMYISRLGAKPRETDFVIDDDDDESLGRLEDGLVASGALTCLDQERSEISKEYPEFELFAHIPRQILESKPKLPVPPSSPVWSISATSYDVGSAAGDDDYAEQRRRWQDQQLDDLALVALPDHSSDREGLSESDASTGSSNNDKSDDDHSNATRNSSSASEPKNLLPAGLRREDEI